MDTCALDVFTQSQARYPLGDWSRQSIDCAYNAVIVSDFFSSPKRRIKRAKELTGLKERKSAIMPFGSSLHLVLIVFSSSLAVSPNSGAGSAVSTNEDTKT
jgi:hypothetical protein